MKTKSARVLTSLIALGLSVGVLPAMADKRVVEQAERQVRDFAARNGKTNPGYPAQLADLANVYLANGMLKEADETFDKTIALVKSFTNSNSELPGTYTRYAMNLSEASLDKSLSQETRQALRQRAQTVLHSGLICANQCPAASSERLSYLYNMIDASRMAGMKTEELAQMTLLDKELTALESNDKLQPQEIVQVAYTLLRMARSYCPSPAFRAARMMPPMQVVSDSAPDKPQTVKEKKFKAAEAFQLRAMAMYNKLRDSDPTRIEAQRSLASWYRFYGQTKQEEFQTQQLSKLLHTTDRNKLFPQPAPCPACGMG